ncbi:MAG: universal stress protein [Gammaproteobacteria bacterium]|nr:universal stress protein [Gammaproteobacteria bacterium]
MSNYNSILIAVDFSEASEQVISRGLLTASQNHASTFLVHVVEHLPPIDFGYEPLSSPDWYNNEEEIIKHAEKNIIALAKKHAIPVSHARVLSGSPKHEIIQFAKDNNIDLIVIGSHGRHGLQRLLGSTAYPVLHNASCDALAVRIKE